MRVDAQAGVIRGVKVLGLESRNGRTYLPEALAEAAQLYEDAKVNVNHPKGNPAGPRDYQDRIGAIRDVAMQPGEGLFADFHFNPKHALAEQLIWDAEHAPENVGFSHNVEARLGRRGERVVVEAITRVQSVDLVADPATTRGLFESAAVEADPSTPGTVPFASTEMTVPSLPTLDRSRRARDYPELVESIRREQAAEVSRLQQEVERLTALEATAAEAQPGAAAACASSICPTRRRPSRGRRPLSAGSFSNRSWRRPTSRRCASWLRSGRGWCGRLPAAAPRSRQAAAAIARSASGATPLDRSTRRVLWKR